MASTTELLQGTLDLLILKAISLGPLHGYGVLLRIQQMSRDKLQIQQGSLYPALARLEHQGLIACRQLIVERQEMRERRAGRHDQIEWRLRAPLPKIAVHEGHPAPRVRLELGALPLGLLEHRLGNLEADNLDIE